MHPGCSYSWSPEFVSGICVSLKFMMKSALPQCIVVAVTVTAYHAVASSMHANFSQLNSKILLHQNSSECPSVWQKIIPLKVLICDGKHAYGNTHYILTYSNANKGIITDSVEDMRYKYLLNGYNLTKDGHHVLLPNNLSELNEYMC